MFTANDVHREIHARLKDQGLNPLHPLVQQITAVVSTYHVELLKEMKGAADKLLAEFRVELDLMRKSSRVAE